VFAFDVQSLTNGKSGTLLAVELSSCQNCLHRSREQHHFSLSRSVCAIYL